MTNKGKPPAFQFYPKDFLTDPKVQMMTDEEVGIYIKLLCYCWLDEGLPLDISMLARMLRCDEARLKLPLEAFQKGKEKWTHKRLTSERKKQKSYRDKMSKAGKKGAKVKADKGLEQQARLQPGLSKASAFSSSPISNLQSTNNKKTKAKKGASGDAESCARLFKDRINGKGLADGKKNFDARIRDGIPIEDLAAAVKNYCAHLEIQPDNQAFAYQMNNFFGQKAYWEDWVDPAPDMLQPKRRTDVVLEDRSVPTDIKDF